MAPTVGRFILDCTISWAVTARCMARCCCGCESGTSRRSGIADGISPAWPIRYEAFEPYYQAAEELYHVHGLRGEDPTEPPSAKPYKYPPISHEPRIQQLFDGLKNEGHHPFHLPVGILLDEANGKPLPHSPCIRCDAFDGYPCLTNGKADAQVICVDPALAESSEFDDADERLCREALDRFERSTHQRRAGVAGGRAGHLCRRSRDRRVRGALLGLADASLGQ